MSHPLAAPFRRGLAALLVATAPVAFAAGELVFLTWSDYVDPAIVAEFERESGVRVRFSFYDSDDVRDATMANSDGSGFDLVLVAGHQIDAYRRRGWLAPLADLPIPNRAHVDPRWRDAFPGSSDHAVPYFWGTLGIAYRRDKIPDGIRSWREFFEPRESLRGRITLLESSRDVLGMALKALGHSANTADRDTIRAAGRLLAAQRPYVRSYEYISLTEDSPLVTGEVWASIVYSGDALMVGEHDARIAYVVPEEGTNLWIDYLTIVSSSPNKELAARFIDFLNRPAVAARNARFVYYATPNLAARAHLDTEYFDNDVIFPTDAVLARSEVYRALPPRSQHTVNSVFAGLVN